MSGVEAAYWVAGGLLAATALKTSNLSSSATKLEALKLQSSAHGVTVPLVYGQARVAVNLLDYRNFHALASTTTQGGKGGASMESTTYTYAVDAVMSVCHGPISGAPRGWRGKRLFSGGLVPEQLLEATETYAVPETGPMTYTLLHGAGFTGTVSLGFGSTPEDFTPLTPERDYAIAGGVLTVFEYDDGRGQITSFRGYTLTLVYQYIVGAVDQTALQQMGLSMLTGAIGQAPWSALDGAHMLGYSGLALLCGQAYDLGPNAQVENHNVEVIGPLAYHLGSEVPDVDTALVLRDVLINARYGAGFPAERMDAWQAWSDWCVAAGLLVSPVLKEQMRAADVIAMAAQVTNTAPVWSGGRLRMVPLADAAVTGNGRTYTPDTTPVYELDDECWTVPLFAKIKTPADRKNHVRVEYLDRANEYNPAIAEAKDQADIDANGLRTANTIQAHWICTADAARLVAQLMLQRSLYVTAEYTGQLPWHFAMLDPADLITATDTGLGLAATPLRVTVIEENEDGDLMVTAEDYPAGVASAPLYPMQAPAGYAADYNVAPGDAAAPFIFEAPTQLAGGDGLAVMVAVTGEAGATQWGGCHVWVSSDGTRYRQMGTVQGGARYGTLTDNTSAVSSVVKVALAGRGGALLSGSTADAINAATLCYTRPASGVGSGEFFAHTTAALTGANAYTLSAGNRGMYETARAAMVAGDGFVRVDSAVVQSEPMPLDSIGQTLHFKFCSFNLYGAAAQTLDEVSAYTYTVRGDIVRLPASNVAGLSVAVAPSGLLFAWAPCDDGDYGDTEVRLGTDWAATTDADRLFKGKSAGWLWNWPPAGAHHLLVSHFDRHGNRSVVPASIAVTVGADGLIAATAAWVDSDGVAGAWTDASMVTAVWAASAKSILLGTAGLGAGAATEVVDFFDADGVTYSNIT